MKSRTPSIGVGLLLALVSLHLLRAGDEEIGGPLEGPKLPLFPTQHGEPAGYPGWLPQHLNKTTDDEHLQPAAQDQPAPPAPEVSARPGGLWPERQLYPGSVEHWRAYWMKYVPVRALFDAGTLRKVWTAPNLPGASSPLENYASPVYRVPRHRPPHPTGKFDAPAPVLRVLPNTTFFDADLGELPIGMYTVRVVGAVETKDLETLRKPIYLRFTINDGISGETHASRLRIGYQDEFYSVAEFYFNAPARRTYRVSLRSDADSLLPLLVQCVDLHDVLAGSARRAIKTRPTLCTPEERAILRRQKTPAKPPPTKIEDMAARLAEDERLWSSHPPINAQYGGMYGLNHGYGAKVVFGAQGKTMEQLEKECGKWTLYAPKEKAYPVLDSTLLINWKQNLRYTIADLTALKPLPGEGAIPDCGASVFTPAQEGASAQNYTVIADSLVGRQRLFNRMMAEAAMRYHETGDLEAGWSAAIQLCRLAWQFPSFDMTQSLGAHLSDPGGFDREYRNRRRDPSLNNPGFDGAGAGWMMQTYDRVFDVIKENSDLAKSVGRFIPWIKTPQDVIELIDVWLVQQQAKRILRYHTLLDNEPTWIVEPATVLGDRSVTDPWMRWLFAKAYIYPNIPNGLGDIAITGNDRDGVGYIGSWFYITGEQSGKYAQALDAYLRAGGNPKYALNDASRFPAIARAPYFMLETWLAGLQFPRIGDVGGPDKGYAASFSATLPLISSGWRWTRDPKFAWVIRHEIGRHFETDAEWSEIERAAARVARSPRFENRSRVLSNWFGALETGLEHDDYRFRRAVMLRVGQGYGHAHNDTLDLQIYAHGVPMTVDGGQRPGYNKPGDATTRLHNVVEVDGKEWQGHAWIRSLTDGEGARYMLAEAPAPFGAGIVQRRQVALVDVDEGRGSTKLGPEGFGPSAKLPGGVLTPNSYVVDVARVSGGQQHTYCFHGPLEDELVTNVSQPVPYEKLPEPEQAYVSIFQNEEIPGYPMKSLRWGGDAPATLTATWRMARSLTNTTALGEARIHPSFDPESPRKYTRLHLLDQAGTRVLTGWSWCRKWKYGYNCLYAQRKGAAPMASVFPAIIEPYTGEPFITNARLLEVTDNDRDANRAVAFEIVAQDRLAEAPGQRTDLVFVDGHPEKTRQTPAGSFSAEFALVSSDAKGLRQASLGGGTTLATPLVEMRLAARERTGKVTRVDHARQELELAPDAGAPWPGGPALEGRVFEVGLAPKWTTYTIRQVSSAGSSKSVTLNTVGGSAFYSSRILRTDPGKREVACLSGMGPVIEAVRPGLDKNLVVSDAAEKHFWRATYTGRTAKDDYAFHLDAPFTENELPVGGTLRVWEYGVGDTVRQATFANLRRRADGSYDLTGDTDLTLRLKGRALEISTDGTAWQSAGAAEKGGWVEAKISAGQLAGKILRLRVTP
ncbi:MAG: heparinase II/III family protein [Verrucomicrobiae bacterium]|nr:heparinase II/III family protein [Verrucomicrobiae bacterium]